ncbi:MAG: hypothetical protein RJA70_3731 [Pseudomonadota bacterium]
MARMAQPKGTHFVVSAGDTLTGAPMYMKLDGTWTSKLSEATPIDDEAQRDALISLARGQERLICDPHAFNVTVDNGSPVPISVREKVRALGPTTPLRRPD